MSAALIAGEGLHSYYGASHVLRGVDIAIAPGETLGLMGRNGMGKTTLIRTLLGLLRPSRGEVLVDGRRMTGAAPSRIARCGIGLVPEGRRIFANLTVKENLLLAARPGIDGSRAWTFERVLQSFPRLAERLSHGGAQLSGGEQQMLAIGRALLTNPRLLILDEATEGLAPLIRQEIWRIVALVRESGLATLIVDKNVAHLATLADRFLVLVKGSVVFSGTPTALLADPELMHRHLGV
jgi:branched-chain amino acid transport system ATP-binding protein